MKGNRKIFWGKVVLIAGTVPVLIQAYEYGPDPGNAGVPGESTCAQCHAGTVNSGPGSVTVTFPGSLTYTPGSTQHLVVTVADPNQRRWGFQLTARLASDTGKSAGTFTAGGDGFTQVLCSAQPYTAQVEAPCPASAPVAFIEHTLKAYQASTSRFEFDWTPPANDAGPVTIYVAGNAANGDLRNTGDRIYTSSYTLTPSSGNNSESTLPVVSDRGVVNAASLQPVISPGSLISILVTNLAVNTRASSGGELPTQLDGVSVSVNGKAAPLLLVSPSQIKALAPDDDTLGDVSVTVANANGTSAGTTVRLERYSPAFFQWGGKYAVASRPDASWVGMADLFPGLPTTPARPGDVLILRGTGFGAADPAVPAGKPADRPGNVASPPVIRMGGVTADYLAGSLAPGSTGLYLIVVRVPDSVPDGDVPIVAESGGIRSPDNVFITVQR
jgi:uncharacterized protein (TIGR03437 family)